MSSAQYVNTSMNILIGTTLVHPIFSFAIVAVASAFYSQQKQIKLKGRPWTSINSLGRIISLSCVIVE